MGLNRFKVTFQPSNKTVSVRAGTLLIDAAYEAGIVLETPCGGQGRCGRCRVKIIEGETSDRDNPQLTKEQIAEGWVLSCVARVVGDLTVSVPPRKEQERIAVETASNRAALPVECAWPAFPVTQRYNVTLPPPSLMDNAPDVDRLVRAMREQYKIESLDFDLANLRLLGPALRSSDWQATVTLYSPPDSGKSQVIDVQPGRAKGPLLALAVDVGTTNCVIDVVDLRSGRMIGQVSKLNKQTSRGEDVISRIIYSERGDGLQELQQLVIATINELIAEAARLFKIDPLDVHEIVMAGNTIMTHLFLGLPSKSLRQEPYVATAVEFPVLRAVDLDVKVNPAARVYCVPAVAAYVGGDTTAGVLASCMFQTERLALFLDVGTNGEIVLGNSDWMMTCACSAGPAFEGAGVRNGMRATTGAIEEVRVNSKTLEPTVRAIGGSAPAGVCGSGLISAVAEMFLTGIIDKSGRFDSRLIGKNPRIRMGDHGAEYVLAWAKESATGADIALTVVDIDNLIRTKAALYSAIAVMVHHAGLSFNDIQDVLIGGAFGRHINVEQAIQIGLLPDLPWERFKFLGNTSVWGAYHILLSKFARKKAEEIARKLTYIELIADNTYMGELTGALFLPHTNIDNFPSVKATLEKQLAGKK